MRLVARSDGCAVDILAGGDEEHHLNKKHATPHLRRRKDFGAKLNKRDRGKKNEWGTRRNRRQDN